MIATTPAHLDPRQKSSEDADLARFLRVGPADFLP
ncbi:hypothetical protein ABIC75_003518 [Dyella japonica]|uniref:Transposase n=1 Tax=Dyella japonica TaxID=231455 RepID=A0ABV2JY65_9GAMM